MVVVESLQQLAGSEKENKSDLLGSLGKALMWGLTQLQRPQQATFHGIRRLQLPQLINEGVPSIQELAGKIGEGWNLETPITGSQLTAGYDYKNKKYINPDKTTARGLVVDLFLDPTNLIGANFAAKTPVAALGFAAKAKKAAKAVDAATDLAKVVDKVSDITNLTGGAVKARSFIETVKDSPITDPKVVENLASEFYKVRNTAEGMAKAELIIKKFPYQAKAMIAGSKIDDAGAFITQAFIKQAQETGNIDEAVKLTTELARKATEAGRFSQALSAWSKLSPEGILRYATSVVDEANRLRPGLNLTIKGSEAQKLVDMAVALGKMPVGDAIQIAARDKATQKLLAEILNLVPPTIGQRLSTAQTMAQLLNPKTIIRNVVGNTIFNGLENINQAAVATPIDKFLSMITKTRTTTLPSIITQVKGTVKGFMEGVDEALTGVPAKIGTQFDIPRVPVFRDKILGSLEKLMNIGLRATDRAAYRAAYDNTLRMLMKLGKVAEPTGDMIEAAHQAGLYRTFQDTNVLTKVFTKIKSGLNAGQDFGLGDMILKYPKTPANLLARSLDYSPIGIVNAFGQMVSGLRRGAFNQKQFVDTFSRGITGTAGIITAAVLAKMGIISALPSKDKEVRELEKLSGEGSYQINASALYRFAMTGFNLEAAQKREGDTLVTYDWAQPVATNIALGANIAQAKDAEKTALDIGSVLTAGTETLAEQPLVSGMRQFFGGYKPGEAVANTIKGIPASFTPTLLKQIAQVSDNTQRQTRSEEMFGFQEALNRVLAKVPGLTQTLPARRNVWGRKAESFQKGENNLFNIFFNPAFITKYRPDKDAQEIIRLMQTTGETRHFPKYVTPTVVIGDDTLKLNPKLQSRYQQIVGQYGKAIIDGLITNPEYAKLTDDQKVSAISRNLSRLNSIVKPRIVAEAYWEDIKSLPFSEQVKYLEEKQKLYKTPDMQKTFAQIFEQIVALKQQAGKRKK